MGSVLALDLERVDKLQAVLAGEDLGGLGNGFLGVHPCYRNEYHRPEVVEAACEIVQFDLSPAVLPFALFGLTQNGLLVGPYPLLFLSDERTLRLKGSGGRLRAARAGFEQARLGVHFAPCLSGGFTNMLLALAEACRHRVGGVGPVQGGLGVDGAGHEYSREKGKGKLESHHGAVDFVNVQVETSIVPNTRGVYLRCIWPCPVDL